MLQKALTNQRLLFSQIPKRNFGAIVKADPSHKFIHASVNKKTMALDGMKGSSL
jgi:hypothetical protein